MKAEIKHLWNGQKGDHSYHFNIEIIRSQHNNELCLNIAIEAKYVGYDLIPSSDTHTSTSQLWDHEVFELFISSHIINNDVTIAPYTEIIVGPSNHWLIIKHKGQDCWSTCDNTTLLETEYQPNFQIDYEKRVWSGNLFIPLRLLPSPLIDSYNTNQLSWLFNAFAIHNATSIHNPSVTSSTSNNNTIERKYYAYNAVPGDYPRFHQLHYFVPLVLTLPL